MSLKRCNGVQKAALMSLRFLRFSTSRWRIVLGRGPLDRTTVGYAEVDPHQGNRVDRHSRRAREFSDGETDRHQHKAMPPSAGSRERLNSIYKRLFARTVLSEPFLTSRRSNGNYVLSRCFSTGVLAFLSEQKNNDKVTRSTGVANNVVNPHTTLLLCIYLGEKGLFV